MPDAPLTADVALPVAVREILRSRLSLDPLECDIEIDGQPPGIAKPSYVAIFEAVGIEERNYDTADGEEYTINVNVIHRAPFVPRDRQRDLLVTGLGGLNAKCQAVINAISGNWEVTTLANSMLAEGDATFFLPLRARRRGKLMYVTGDWFGQNTDVQKAAVVRTLTFSKAERIVTHEQMRPTA